MEKSHDDVGYGGSRIYTALIKTRRCMLPARLWRYSSADSVSWRMEIERCVWLYPRSKCARHIYSAQKVELTFLVGLQLTVIDWHYPAKHYNIVLPILMIFFNGLFLQLFVCVFFLLAFSTPSFACHLAFAVNSIIFLHLSMFLFTKCFILPLNFICLLTCL